MDVDSCSSSSGSEDYSVEAANIDKYRSEIEVNSQDYDAHVNLINGLHYLLEYEDARVARQNMKKHYPLSPELWLQWIEDEITTEADKTYLKELLDESIKDYQSVDLYLKYINFLFDKDYDENEKRKIINLAIDKVGSYTKDGYKLWNLLHHYEMIALKETLDDKSKLETIDRIYELFLKQFSLPLNENYENFDRAKTWCIENNKNTIDLEKVFIKSEKVLESIKPFEEKLLSYENTYGTEKSLETSWIEYLNYAEKELSENQFKSLCERAITDVCLSKDIWLIYLKYLDRNSTKEEIVTQYERCLQNCKYSLEIWLNYARYLEKYDYSVDFIRKTYNKPLQQQLTEPNSFVILKQSYIDFERRHIQKLVDKKEDIDLTHIRNEFEALIAIPNYLDYDPQCCLVKYWAFIEAKYGNNIEKSRELWNLIRKSIGVQYFNIWLENFYFEQRFGDINHLKRLANNSLNEQVDYPEYLHETIIRIFGQEGDLDMFLQLKKRIDIYRLKNKTSLNFDTQRKNLKRKNSTQPSSVSKKQKISKESKQEAERKDVTKPEISGETKKETDSHIPDMPIVYDDTKTIFVSNLDFKVTKKLLLETFSKVGPIKDIRLGLDSRGNFRGFAYIQFENEKSYESGLKMEHKNLLNRPMFVSKSNPKQRHKFEYNVDKEEKNKLFVKNLPKIVTKYALEEVFKKYGKLIDIRLPVFRNGIPKSIAFIEYETEEEAQKALLETNGLKIGDNEIEVFISKTPAKKQTNDNEEGEEKKRNITDTSSSTSSVFKPPTILPRAMLTQRKLIHQNTVESKEELKIDEKKSNDDFRKFLK